MIVGDVERLDLPFPPGRFDAIVCGDILEHLANPIGCCGRPRRGSNPTDGWSPASPTCGITAWCDGARGELDIRIGRAARSDPSAVLHAPGIEKLFFRAGFAIDEMRSVVGPGDREAVENLRGQSR